MEYLVAFAVVLSGLLYLAWTRKKSYNDFMRKRNWVGNGIIERKIVDYKVIFGVTHELHQRVKEYLEDGWELYGNPFVVKGSGIYQAIVRYE